ncbi:hypothetical protein B9Z55_025716 [Caenorhabditis nigoni]|uniref:Uncharacterized protein n=1 Tax=Caenorhabditis nigoni TaxID=1611254 RepID=A0A2G5SZW7_9PELO|nr:hypothetical protein B9Z55_025716 [Caenorhabditis nigoni]
MPSQIDVKVLGENSPMVGLMQYHEKSETVMEMPFFAYAELVIISKGENLISDQPSLLTPTLSYMYGMNFNYTGTEN